MADLIRHLILNLDNSLLDEIPGQAQDDKAVGFDTFSSI